jgi:DNA-binding CsgD family transcriptional regulator
VERLSALELKRIGELLAEDAPFWRLRQEVPRSRYAIYRAVKRLRRPPAPEPNRSRLRLSLAEREEISRGVAAGESLRVIARRLGRTPSTVSREVARNGGRASYRACRADRAAVRSTRRPKVAKLTQCGEEPFPTWAIDESAVTISVTVKRPYREGDCLAGETAETVIGLDERLAGRAIIDGRTGEPIPVRTHP